MNKLHIKYLEDGSLMDTLMDGPALRIAVDPESYRIEHLNWLSEVSMPIDDVEPGHEFLSLFHHNSIREIQRVLSVGGGFEFGNVIDVDLVGSGGARFPARLGVPAFDPEDKNSPIEVLAEPRKSSQNSFWVKPVRLKKWDDIETNKTALSNVVKMSNLAVFEWDLDESTMYCSKTAFRFMGIQSETEQLSVRSFLNTFHPAERREMRQVYEQIQEAWPQQRDWSATWTRTARVLWPDGSVRWIEAEFGTEFNDSESTCLVGALRDVTAGTEVRRELKRFRELVDQTSDGLFVVDPETSEFIDCNEAAARQRECSRADLLDKSVVDVRATSDAPEEVTEKIQKIIDKGEYTFRTRHVRKDGSPFPVEVTARYVDSFERPYILANTRDITERKRREDRLQLLSLVANHTENGVMIMDSEGRVQWTNEKFVERTGYDDIVGKKPMAYEDDEFQLPPEYKEAIDEQEKKEIEFKLRQKSGDYYWVTTQITPVRTDGGEVEYIIAVGRDITERKKTEKALRQAQKMEALGRLAGGIAHDFDNYLSVIFGYATWIEDMIETDTALSEKLQQILEACDSASELTDQLTAFAGKGHPDKEIFDVNSVVRKTAQMLEHTLGEKVSVEIDLVDMPLDVEMGRNSLEQILLNLGNNARDAMPDGGTLRITTRRGDFPVSLEKESDSAVVLEIEDTGVGMDRATQNQVFEPFFTTKNKEDGTGLGLAICYRLVEAAGGDLTVESTRGEGTTFSIFLPEHD